MRREVNESQVQKLLDEWDAEGSPEQLPLNENQRAWLYKAIYIFQAHENAGRPWASEDDRIFTEAMRKYITAFVGRDAGDPA